MCLSASYVRLKLLMSCCLYFYFGLRLVSGNLLLLLCLWDKMITRSSYIVVLPTPLIHNIGAPLSQTKLSNQNPYLVSCYRPKNHFWWNLGWYLLLDWSCPKYVIKSMSTILEQYQVAFQFMGRGLSDRLVHRSWAPRCNSKMVSMQLFLCYTGNVYLSVFFDFQSWTLKFLLKCRGHLSTHLNCPQFSPPFLFFQMSP